MIESTKNLVTLVNKKLPDVEEKDVTFAHEVLEKGILTLLDEFDCDLEDAAYLLLYVAGRLYEASEDLYKQEEAEYVARRKHYLNVPDNQRIVKLLIQSNGCACGGNWSQMMYETYKDLVGEERAERAWDLMADPMTDLQGHGGVPEFIYWVNLIQCIASEIRELNQI
jgi:hypothetical protein